MMKLFIDVETFSMRCNTILFMMILFFESDSTTSKKDFY